MNLDDICKFISEREAMVSVQYGTDITLSIGSNQVLAHGFGPANTQYRHRYETGYGPTIQDAVNSLMEKFPDKKHQAHKLRVEASELIKQAIKLEQEAAQ